MRVYLYTLSCIREIMKSIILAGGVGTRLWTLSCEYYPKQFIQFDGHSLF
jgi:mannose-1-phosphate guanylyltransferase/mannose-6-phosphate isomerase